MPGPDPAVQAQIDQMKAALRAGDYAGAAGSVIRSLAPVLGARWTPGGLIAVDDPHGIDVDDAILRIEGHLTAMTDRGDISGFRSSYGYCENHETLYVRTGLAFPVAPEYIKINLDLPEDPGDS